MSNCNICKIKTFVYYSTLRSIPRPPPRAFVRLHPLPVKEKYVICIPQAHDLLNNKKTIIHIISYSFVLENVPNKSKSPSDIFETPDQHRATHSDTGLLLSPVSRKKKNYSGFILDYSFISSSKGNA